MVGIEDQGAIREKDSYLEHETNHSLEDRESREAFIQASYVGLFRWFCRLTGSPDRAADLTQETYAQFWKSADRVPPGVDPRTWLYAIGRNHWRKESRDRRDFAPFPRSGLACDRPSVERRAEVEEFQRAAEDAVTRLPDDLREAFTLRFWHEFEYEEIGRIQGVTAGLARWRYFAARRRLHETLAAWDPDQRRTREDRHAR